MPTLRLAKCFGLCALLVLGSACSLFAPTVQDLAGGGTTRDVNPMGGAGGAPMGGAGGATNAGAGAGNGSSAEATIVPDPSWTCGMPDGIAPPAHGDLVFRATIELGAIHDVGITQHGHRRVLDVTGGTLTGDRIQATVIAGGLDLELMLSNGALELEELETLRVSDGTLISLHSCGVTRAGDQVVRVVPDFEVASTSSLAWLNTGKFAGTRVLNAAESTLELTVYDISKVVTAAPWIRLADPTDVPNQTWECSTATGSKGATVFTASLDIGASLLVGASKHGTRQIIPITGGTTSGRVAGAVIPGEDFQLVGPPPKYDARYMLSTNDGELIFLRNCGPTGALVPSFEARADGPYAFLNANTFLSSDPVSLPGRASLTFYELQ